MNDPNFRSFYRNKPYSFVDFAIKLKLSGQFLGSRVPLHVFIDRHPLSTYYGETRLDLIHDSCEALLIVCPLFRMSREPHGQLFHGV